MPGCISHAVVAVVGGVVGFCIAQVWPSNGDDAPRRWDYILYAPNDPFPKEELCKYHSSKKKINKEKMAANEEEQRYLALVREIIEKGDPRLDRTAVGTRALFGRALDFDLGEHFPLLTTKRVFWRGAVEELLWFIRGNTSAVALAARGVHIWDQNGTREFLDSRGLVDREEGDLGPVYGFQWRHWGAKYTTARADYTGQGVDQLAEVIRKIKEDPADRRIVLSAWNVEALPEMALPPCHMFCQFFVAGDRLSCQMYQRSADMGLGVPFNIASYALLTHLVAHVCGLRPHRLIMVFGDAHVYETHLAPLLEQCDRVPRSFPTLHIKRQVSDIEDFTIGDLELRDYEPYPPIAMKMAV